MTQTFSGQTTKHTHGDRLTSVTLPDGHTDTFSYNGLGMRVGKTDSTGTHSYLCDGTSPGADVLSDGHALYTPGLSENTGGVSRYYSNDRLGNLWTLDGSSKNQLGYEDFSGFGGVTAQSGTGSVFGYGGGNGCQTEADTGLVLMGHRYYDTRIGRFISQDPAEDGDNWYEYAGNSPTNEIDPTGLWTPLYNNLGVGGGQDGTGQRFIGDAEGVAALQQAFEDAHGLAGFNGYWTNGTGTMILKDEKGQPYVANAGEGHTTWVPGLSEAADWLGWLGPEFASEKINPHRFDVLLGTGGTYVLKDPNTGDVMRTGRTNDLARREAQHAKKFPSLKFVIDKVTNSYAEQRGREQMIQDLYKAPLDKIRGISWKNARLFEYLEAAAKFIK